MEQILLNTLTHKIEIFDKKLASAKLHRSKISIHDFQYFVKNLNIYESSLKSNEFYILFLIENFETILKIKNKLKSVPANYSRKQSFYKSFYKYQLTESQLDYITKKYKDIFEVKLGFTDKYEHTQLKINILFSNFLKGITYFKNQKLLSFPVYHRKESCGSKQYNAYTKFYKRDTNKYKNIMFRKASSRICYIERYIYNVIYNLYFKEQDSRHRVELKKMERICQNYNYNNMKINVIFDKKIPIGLVIENGNREIEYYYKTYNIVDTSSTNNDIFKIQYKKPVKCIKCVNNTLVYKKTQSFQKKEQWQKGKHL